MTYLFGHEWSRAELLAHVSNMDALAGIKYVEGADGRERGVRMLEAWTGSGLQFRVLADRTMDISACTYKGIPLAWSSSVGDIHPAYYEPEKHGFLRSFQGGLLATCGLDQYGEPNDDQGEVLGQHGRVTNLPAQSVSYTTRWDGENYLLEMTGLVRQTRVFGENLVLRRRLTTALGSSRIRIDDTVTNEGGEPWPHMILYHFNFGFPLIGPAATLHVDAQQTELAFGDEAVEKSAWSKFPAPSADFKSRVYRHTPNLASDGLAYAVVENPQIGLRVSLSFDTSTLPYLNEWTYLRPGTYVVGIEPVNSRSISGRAYAREINDLVILEPGESRHHHVELDIEEIASA